MDLAVIIIRVREAVRMLSKRAVLRLTVALFFSLSCFRSIFICGFAISNNPHSF